MPTRLLKKLVHLSQQPCMPNTRLVPDHNDKDFGIIEDAVGREIYFSHEAVHSRCGFDDLRRGQQLEYTLELAPYLRANSVCVASETPASALRPAV